ncbi:MAG: hypothetical protein U0167_08300 [bacterium]
MRRSVSLIGLVFGLVSLAAVAAFASDTATAPVPSGTSERVTVDKSASTAPQEFAYGPILSQDPVVRGQIKKLYRDQWDYNQTANAQIAQLSQQAAAETDGDLRAVVEREAMQAKKDMELKNVDFGLRIARLNGDAVRVADFEKALDQLLHPEKYRPATADPSVAQERARKLGLIK